MSKRLMNKTQDIEVSRFVEVASSFKARSKGLLGRDGLESGHCLWIHKCKSIHTFFMKFPIDVVYVDKNLVVTKVHRNVSPWALSWGGIKSDSCFEFQTNSTPLNLQQGDQLSVSS